MNLLTLLLDQFVGASHAGNFIGMTLPAKAQGYLSAGKPIVGAVDGAASEMILQADCGEVVKAGDAKGLAEKMSLVIDNFKAYKQKGMNGRIYYEKNFTKEIFMESLLNIIKN